MSSFLVSVSATGAPMPMPALFTSTSSLPKRSLWAATRRLMSSSSATFAATAFTSSPSSVSPLAAASSLSGRRAESVIP